MTALQKWIDWTILGMMLLAGAGLIMMMLHISADVGARYFFNDPIRDTVETVSYYYMIIVIFLPLAFVERKSEHIEVELVVQFLSTRVRNILYIIARLFGAAFFAALAYETWFDAMHYLRIREVPMGSSLEIWPARFILPVSFAVLILSMLLHAMKAALALGHPKPQGDGPIYARDVGAVDMNGEA